MGRMILYITLRYFFFTGDKVNPKYQGPGGPGSGSRDIYRVDAKIIESFGPRTETGEKKSEFPDCSLSPSPLLIGKYHGFLFSII